MLYPAEDCSVKEVFFHCLSWTAFGGSYTDLIVEEVTLNSYFSQKRLQIKTEESSSEKILTILLSWTILHYHDSLIGCKKKWQFKIKGFKWDNPPVPKFAFEKNLQGSKYIFSPLVSYFLFSMFCAEITLSDVSFHGKFWKSVWDWLLKKWTFAIYDNMRIILSEVNQKE